MVIKLQIYIGTVWILCTGNYTAVIYRCSMVIINYTADIYRYSMDNAEW